jgi:hypothetical protein
MRFVRRLALVCVVAALAVAIMAVLEMTVFAPTLSSSSGEWIPWTSRGSRWYLNELVERAHDIRVTETLLVGTLLALGCILSYVSRGER